MMTKTVDDACAVDIEHDAIEHIYHCICIISLGSNGNTSPSSTKRISIQRRRQNTACHRWRSRSAQERRMFLIALINLFDKFLEFFPVCLEAELLFNSEPFQLRFSRECIACSPH